MQLYFLPVHWYLANVRKKGRNPGPYLGKAFSVPREGLPDVRVRLYRPTDHAGVTLPVLFNVHGGAWVHGDAEGLDLQSQYLANHLNCFVVNVDYRRLDERPFPYPQTETADTVGYFLAHAAEYGIDPEKAALAGYSAGGHIVAGAAMMLRDRGVKLTAQVLGYPFLNFVGFDFAAYGNITGRKGRLFNRLTKKMFFRKMPMDCALLSPAHAAPEELKGLVPAVVIGCGKGDPLLPQAEEYAEKLKLAGVPVAYREYTEAVHGFLERNFEDDPAVFAAQDEQDRLMREAVDFLRDSRLFGEAELP
ncbi:MAG: alpha/beta hydrolase [Clostridia bacterium]|nr:alpha/beta hydrolase [Clostridia bacterium]